jgi:hypothetical protein|nr:MAG TPA: hypothetical protein [Caudoviricetes sp.]
MIVFRQKEYSEYDAMRSLYVELMRYSDRNRFDTIDKSALIPILKGNNIVIERFVISTTLFGKDRYRMYLKIGAKAKMPDEVRLPSKVYDKRLGNMQVNVNSGIFADNQKQQYQNNNAQNNNQQGNKGRNQQPKQTNNSEVIEKQFADKKGPPPFISGSMSPYIDLTVKVQELLGDAIVYDKQSRTLVLEFKSIRDAIQALNILPFGLNYKIYLLDS